MCVTRSVSICRRTGIGWRKYLLRAEVPGPRIHQAIHVVHSRYLRAAGHADEPLFFFIAWYASDQLCGKGLAWLLFRAKASAQEVRDRSTVRLRTRRYGDQVCDQPEKFMTYSPVPK